MYTVTFDQFNVSFDENLYLSCHVNSVCWWKHCISVKLRFNCYM